MSFAERLTAAIEAEDLTGRGEPVQLNKWFGAELNLAVRPGEKRWRPARFTYVSDKANVRPRLNQFLSTRPVVAAAVLGRDAEPGTREDLVEFAMARVVGLQRPAEIFVLVTEETPQILDLIGDPDHPTMARLMALAPKADLHPVVGSGEPRTVRGPVVDLPDMPLVVDPRLERMLRLAIATSPAVMLVGPPGTGKGRLVDHLLGRISADPSYFGLRHAPRGVRRITAEESWTFQDLVGGLTVAQGELVFRPGFLLQALANDEWLVLDEANRADLDKIFGALLTWLAGQDVQVATSATTADAPVVELGWDREAESAGGPSFTDLAAPAEASGPLRYLADADWRIIGTYNALDAQRVFRMGQALGRRFMRVPVQPIDADQFREVLASWTTDLPDRVGEVLGGLYSTHLESDIQLGPAVFLRAASYVVNGLKLEFGYPAPEGDPEQEPPSSEEIDGLLVEAYLLGVGTLLAQQRPEELERLRTQTLEREILSEGQWSFLEQQLISLA